MLFQQTVIGKHKQTKWQRTNLMASRSPSPPPQYDNFGRRINTREYRYRKRLEDERHKQIEKAMKIIPNYHPPADYRRPTKTQEKVYVPVNDYPEINFSMITNPLTPLLFLFFFSFGDACGILRRMQYVLATNPKCSDPTYSAHTAIHIDTKTNT
jgi:hypothetical protein